MTTTSVTKSVRLTKEEAEELARVARQTAATEASLMKKWILEGLQAQKLERAIEAYMNRKVDLRGGALMAGVSYNRFLSEIEARHIVILEDSDFLDRLHWLGEHFDNQALQKAVEEVENAFDRSQREV